MFVPLSYTDFFLFCSLLILIVRRAIMLDLMTDNHYCLDDGKQSMFLTLVLTWQ